MANIATTSTVNWDQIEQRVERLLTVERPRYRRLWGYYRNPMRASGASRDSGSDRPYRQAQEWGLPARITGRASGADVLDGQLIDQIARKEVVIENDIAWRVDTLVDYLFAKPLVIRSIAPDASKRARIEQLLKLILSSNGGVLLLQQLALLGGVYGFVDVLVKLRTEGEAEGDGARAPEAERDASQVDDGHTRDARDGSPEALMRLARMVRLEIVEPARALPFVSSQDWRVIDAYGQCWEVARRQSSTPATTWLDRARSGIARWLRKDRNDDRSVVVEMITADRWWRMEDGKVVAQGVNSLGRVPVVHIQNTAMPYEYSGVSDVEPLIPLQDELNTRLSDRANRIALQSFKMYLGKGIENFTEMPVAPGRMWMTDNEQAEIIEFGGDAESPSETTHIADMREALDKTSGVTPIAAGAIKGRIGHLTSAAALRITLQALLGKTEKKRRTYGAGLEQICELALAWLDRAGVFATTPAERRVELKWQSPLPENRMEALEEAASKIRLGIPEETVLSELGY